MPVVDGKKYPYTKAGMAAAKKAADKKKPMRKTKQGTPGTKTRMKRGR